MLCKNAVDKHAAKMRLTEDRHHEQTRREPTYRLTDAECLAIEARLAGSELYVFEGHGWKITDAREETNYAATEGLREAWADRGADLDVWQLRRMDRQRFGGIVMTPAMHHMFAATQLEIMSDDDFGWFRSGDPLQSPTFHLKTFAFEIDELYEMETS